MYKWYITPEIIAQMPGTKVIDRCWKCDEKKGTLYHIWWKCKKTRQYLAKIYKEILQIYKVNIPKLLEMMLLGLYLELIPSKKYLLWYLLTTARIQFARIWRQKEIPTMSNWRQYIIQSIEMDKFTRKVREQKIEKFDECWEKVKITWKINEK